MKKTQEKYLIELRKQLNKSAMFGSNMLHRHQSLIHSDPQTESFHLEYTVQLLSQHYKCLINIKMFACSLRNKLHHYDRILW